MRPIVLGNKEFPVNLIQGPLAGISCAPFRRLTWEQSRPAFSCTEMISCKTLIHMPVAMQHRYVKKDAQEGPVCFQLASNDPNELAEGVKRVTDLGADLIDLNCGCPVKKIRQKGAGSRLLSDPSLLYQLITSMKKNTHVPVSVKIRVSGNKSDISNQDIAYVVRDAGADFLVVHGRHWTEHYETSCRYDDIQFFVEALNIPVIGNGDIACIESLQKMLATGCAGVMIGRAGVGQPWLIRELIAALNQTAFDKPTFSQIGLMLMQHVEGLVELLQNEKFAILQARKFAKYYAKGLPERMEFYSKVNECEDENTFKKLCLDYFV